MQNKTHEQIEELFKTSSISVTRRGTVDARPTVPGEILICDNYGGAAVSVNDGYAISYDKKRLYYTHQEYAELFEVVPNGMEGPGNTRECRFKGTFAATQYTGEPFVYRRSDGPLSVVQSGTYLVAEFGDFSAYTEKEFERIFKNG